MLEKSMDILTLFPVRKSRKQKQAFRENVKPFAEKLGYSVNFEEFRSGGQNVIIGDPGKAKYLVTAHYDTPASIGIPNFLTPCNPLAFILYQTLVIGVYFLIAFVVGYLTSLVTDDRRLIFLTSYIAYFAVLLLMMMGPANRHNANDNTSGVVSVLEIASNLPQELRSQVAFILFDLEERGLKGSAAYRKAHKEQTEKQIVLNLDCVGDGEHFLLVPVKNAKKDEGILSKLRLICTKEGQRTISLLEKGFVRGNSDHKNFPNGVGIMAFHKAKGIGYYCGRIHTWRDKILDETNVSVITNAILKLIASEVNSTANAE